MRIERAHLYVEKYSRYSHELILDFTQEDEFIFFRNQGDYTPEMHLPRNRFEPTILIVHDCAPTHKIREGMILVVGMDELIGLASAIRHSNFSDQDVVQSRARMIFGEIDNGTDFAKLIDNAEILVTNNIPENLYYHLTPTWSGPPCALEELQDDFELRIWDVGQGSTNSISDRDNLALFDFGASIHFSQSRREAIMRKHATLLAGKKRVSLIISHWDCDHINLLCDADDNFLQNICCVFYPPEIISLTAKQIAARISKNCRCRVEILPKIRRIRNKCGIQREFSGSGYVLYTGENSKDKNQSGLLLALSSKTATALLTADHTNYQVWDVMFNDVVSQDKVLHIVVPHHGGNCGKTAVRTVASPGKSVISVGSNTYGHPTWMTITGYRRAHYKLIRTDIVGDDIVIHMK